MTRQTFNEVLELNNITWNDLVRITIINPYAKWWKIFTPQTLVFDGALDYTLNSYHVGLCVDDDATTGKIMFNSPKSGDYSWVEESFTDLDDALSKLNMLISSQLLVSAAWALDIQSKLTTNTANIGGTTNTFNVKTFQTYTENTKDKLIAKLEETLNILKTL